MYESFYGLKEKPFSLLPDPAYLYLSKQHEMAMTLLEYSLENQAGFCVVSGKAGTGKTTLLRRLLNRIGDDVTVGLITNTHHSFGELLRWILHAFNLEDSGQTRAELHQIFVDYLIRQYAKNQRTMLIIDEAQNMSADALEELRMLSNINSEKDLLLQVILVGQPALREILRRPELEQFAQRIAVDYHLDSLGREETRSYIRHRIVVAGGESELFSADACDAVFEYSGGIPRLINLLCDFALVYAYAGQAAVVTGELVDQVVSEREAYGALPVFVHGNNRVAKSLSGGGVSAAAVAQTLHKHAGSRTAADVGSVIAMDAHAKAAAPAFEVGAQDSAYATKASSARHATQVTAVHGQSMKVTARAGSAKDSMTDKAHGEEALLSYAAPGVATPASAASQAGIGPEHQAEKSGVTAHTAVTADTGATVAEAEGIRHNSSGTPPTPPERKRGSRPVEPAQSSSEQQHMTDHPPRAIPARAEVVSVSGRPAKQQTITPFGFVARFRGARAASMAKRYVPAAAVIALFLAAPLVWRVVNHRFEQMSPVPNAAPRPPVVAATPAPPAKPVSPEASTTPASPVNVPATDQSAAQARPADMPLRQVAGAKPAAAKNDSLQAEKKKLIENERAAARAIAKAKQRERDAERDAALARERALAAEHEAALERAREQANQQALAAEKARQEARAAAAAVQEQAQQKKPGPVKSSETVVPASKVSVVPAGTAGLSQKNTQADSGTTVAAVAAQQKKPEPAKPPEAAVPANKVSSAPVGATHLPQKNTEADAGATVDPEAGSREPSVFTANPCKGPSARFLSTCE